MSLPGQPMVQLLGAPATAAAPAAAADSPPIAQHVRLLSWNVNGLRAALKRLNVTISQFLEGLGADIICLQETKLRRCDIDRELAVVEGWDSFFCCDTTRATGYSGTATYVRSGVALPFAAEEGFTGCAPLAAGNGAAAAAASVCAHPALAGHFGPDELAEMDAEGRVLVTDHGSFVLFNLYGPAITNADTAEDRSEFKLRFYRALELRWRQLLQQGRAVVAVGDFNITPAPIDYREERKRDVREFFKSRTRLWLRRMLHGCSGLGSTPLSGGPPATEAAAVAALTAALGEAAARSGADGAEGSSGGGGSSSNCGAGLLVDTFRHFHPARQSAFTCWSTATNARVNNWGSRIDLILAGGLSVGNPPAEQPPGVAAAGEGAEGPAAAAAAASAAGGSKRAAVAAAVWVAGGDIWPDQQGSDHCPVWADLAVAGGAAFPCAATAPPSAMRFVFAGKQLKLHGWLQRGLSNTPTQASCESSQGSPPLAQQQQQQQQRAQQQASLPDGSQQLGDAQPPSQGLHAGTQQSQAAVAAGPAVAGMVAPGPAAAAAGAAAAAAGLAGKKQATLKSFFQQPQHGQQTQQGQQGQQGQQPPAVQHPQHQQPQQPQQPASGATQAGNPAAGGAGSSAFIAAELAAAASSKQASVAQAKDAWRSIQQRFQQVPKCFHGEAAEQKRVNKTGPNQGRYFWRCARPAGPRPEGDCGYFKWVEARPGDPPHLTLVPSKSSGPGKGGSSGSGKDGGRGSGGGDGAGSAKRLKP